MPLQQVFSQQVEVDARGSSVPLEYRMNLPNLISVPLSMAWERGTLNLSLLTQSELYYDTEPSDQVFANPTEFRAGKINFQRNNYSYRREYLTYERQLFEEQLTPIAVTGTINAAPIVLRSTDKSLQYHAYSIADTKLCAAIEQTPGELAPSYLDGTIPAASLCMRITPGQQEFIQVPATNYDQQFVAIDLDNYFHSYSISGVVIGGIRLVVRSTMYYLFENSGIEDTSTSVVIQGAGPVPAYGYTCNFGQPVPRPENPPCPPTLLRVNYPAFGDTPELACIDGISP